MPKISALTAGTTPDGSELFPAVQGGSTVSFTLQQLSALNGIRSAITSNYTVLATDLGKNVALGGNSFYTLTVGAPSGYVSNFAVMISNEDQWSSGRAKKINYTSGGTAFLLWPQQSVLIFRSGSVWRQSPDFQRARLPSTGITINTDFASGTDTNLATDGLATGAAALKTVNNAFDFVLKYFDWAGITADPGIKILMAASSTDTTAVHFSPHSLVGSQGSNAIRLDGNGSTIYPASGTAIGFFYGATVRIRNITLKSDTKSGIAAYTGARIYIEDAVTFAKSANNGAIYCENAQLKILNSFTFSGANAHATALIENNGGRIDTDGNAVTATISANQNLTQTVYGYWPGITDLQQFTWSVGAFTITATNKYSLIGNHVQTGSAGIPGTGPGNATTGSQAL